MSNSNESNDQNQQNQQQKQNMEVELPESEAAGTYSNLVMITHSPSEFVIDFLSVMPGVPKAKVKKRMVLTPDHAKRLYNALGENLKKYEGQFGDISGNNKQQFNMNYRGPIPEA